MGVGFAAVGRFLTAALSLWYFLGNGDPHDLRIDLVVPVMELLPQSDEILSVDVVVAAPSVRRNLQQCFEYPGQIALDPGLSYGIIAQRRAGRFRIRRLRSAGSSTSSTSSRSLRAGSASAPRLSRRYGIRRFERRQFRAVRQTHALMLLLGTTSAFRPNTSCICRITLPHVNMPKSPS